MKPINLLIQVDKTGENIQDLMKQRGYTVKDIQQEMGLENPQVVYDWLSGKSLPTLDNILSLSKTLDVSIDDILAYEGGGLD